MIQTWTLIVVPIVVATIAGGFAYRQARTVATRNAETENRRIDTEGFDKLVKAQQLEIERLRGDREEDQKQHREDVRRLTERLDSVEQVCTRHRDRLSAFTSWARTVVTVLEHPEVVATLAMHQVVIPAPPLED